MGFLCLRSRIHRLAAAGRRRLADEFYDPDFEPTYEIGKTGGPDSHYDIQIGYPGDSGRALFTGMDEEGGEGNGALSAKLSS